MLKRTSLMLAVGLILPAAAGVVACNSRPRNSQADAAEIPSATVAAVGRGTIAHTLNLAGQFQPYQVIDVHAKVSGYIKHIYVDIGDRVKQGQLLAVLEVPELDAQLKGTVAEVAHSKDEITRAQHELTRAQAQHAALHADYVRLKQAAAAQPGLIAEQELDDAQSKDLAAEAQVDAAKAALAAADQQSQVAGADNERVSDMNDYTRVTAPFDGVVIWRDADTGALIQAGTSSDVQTLPVVRLSQSSILRLRVPVPEDDIRFVNVGDQMQVRVDALGRSFSGKVVRFTRDVSQQTRTMETEIDVENKDLSIDPGMYANTNLQLERKDNVLTIPVTALWQRDHDRVVYALDKQNRVRIQQVQVGIEGAHLAEIKNGLADGDLVILGGQQKYHEGEQVAPIVTKIPTSDVAPQPGGMIDLHDEQEGVQ